MKEPAYYADKLYVQALTDPEVNSLDEQNVARYIRQEAERLCLDWRAVLDACGSLQPYTVDFKKASELVGDEAERFKAYPALY